MLTSRCYSFLNRFSPLTDLVYPSGMSITLPEEIQRLVLRTCKGLEQVEMAQPGYGVEYDYVNPRELKGARPAPLSLLQKDDES